MSKNTVCGPLEQSSAFGGDTGLIVVGIADIKLGRGERVIRTTLGSCIAVCLYSQAQQAGGMLHFMMPAPPPSELAREGLRKAKYAQTGIPELLHQMKQHFGLEPGHMTVKIFGGASLLPSVTRNIGLENETVAREILRKFGMRVSGYMTGGTKGYKVDFDLKTGKVRCQVFGEPIQEI